MIEAAFCPVCRSRRHIRLYTRDISASDAGGYRRYILDHVLRRERLRTEMRLCPDCALLYLSPRFTPEELDRLYSPAYFALRPVYEPGWVDPSLAAAPRIAASEAARREMIAGLLAPHAPGARRILDMGGGTGSLIPRLPGLEEAYVCDTGVSRTEPHVRRLAEPEDAAPFDIVMCTHVLEHVHDPRAFLARLVAVTAPGGILYVEMPYEGPPALYRRQGLGEHLNFFTRTALRRLAAECGLAVVDLQERRYDYALWETNALCAVLSPMAAAAARPAWRAFPVEIGTVAARRIRGWAARLRPATAPARRNA